MNEKCYSYNEEDFDSDFSYVMDQKVENFLEDNPEFEGETELEIFEADKVKNTISKFLGTCIADVLTETACDDDDGGEAAEGWASKIIRNSGEIQKTVRDALENWADQTNNQPNFFGVKNVCPINVKIKIDKDGYWDIVES
jgi:hypothetical protein